MKTALISILLLVLAGGAWLVDTLRHSSKITLEPHRDRRTERYVKRHQAQQDARRYPKTPACRIAVSPRRCEPPPRSNSSQRE